MKIAVIRVDFAAMQTFTTFADNHMAADELVAQFEEENPDLSIAVVEPKITTGLVIEEVVEDVDQGDDEGPDTDGGDDDDDDDEDN